jgi:hypothetical protein
MIEIFQEISDLIFGNKRLEALKHFAQAKDFGYKKRFNVDTLPIEVQKMDLYKSKKKKSIKGVLYKSFENHETTSHIFDLISAGDLGSNTTTSYLFYSPKLNLPYFIIKPRNSFSKIGNIFGGSEWSEFHPNFDKEFVIESNDLNYMRMAMTIQFTDTMLQLKGYSLEGFGKYLLLYKPNDTTDIIDMDNTFDAGIELVDIILNDYSSVL